jgi:glyoxylase-like metal-dependent hydrolase (beta-lactamase superfamily II)
MKRRDFLYLGAAGMAAQFLMPRRVWAADILDLGNVQLQTLSDGNLVLPGSPISAGLSPDEIADLIARYNLSSDLAEPPCNLTLLRDGARTILFDIGAGGDFMPSTGQFLDSLDALGLSPEEITDLVITHGHPDHIWGLLDDFDEPMLPNATIHMGRAEWDYWTDPDTVNTIGEVRASFAIGASRRLDAIAENVVLFDDGDEILPNVQAVATPGHTPGHMAFHIAGSVGGAIVVGDALGNHHVAFEHPDLPSASDQDTETGAATRVALLDRIIADNLTVIGFHLPEGGIGRAERRADTSYVFIPEV